MENKKRKFEYFRLPRYIDKPIHYAIMTLAVFGFIMVVSASMGLAIGDNNYLIATGIKLFLFTMVGYMGMTIMARFFTFKRLNSLMEATMVVTVILLMACLGFSGSGGAKAWIQIPIAVTEVTFQPSEIAKLVCVLCIANYLGDNMKIYRKPWNLIKYPISFVMICAFIILVLQSDLGSAAVLLIMSTVSFLILKNPSLRKIQKGIVIVGVIGALLAFFLLYTPMGENFIRLLPLKDYQINRILSAINPFIDRYNTGYQLINGLVAFASGGFFGVGFGNSIRKYTDFPASNTDFILAIVVEELGFMGFLLIAICYMVIIIRLYKYAFKMKNEKGRIVLAGVATYLFVHFLFNVGGVTGFIPLTGVPLLMISAGGTSTFATMVAIGLGQAIISQYRQGVIE